MHPLLQTNFEALSYITDLFLGGIGLLMTTLGVSVSIYTLIIARKAMNDWQTQRNYDVIIEALVEVDNLYNEIIELRTPPERPWNMYATEAYIKQPSYMRSIVSNPLFSKYGRVKHKNYDSIIKKLDLQLGDNPILDFLTTKTKLISELEGHIQYYAEEEDRNPDNCYEEVDENVDEKIMKLLWDYIFNTTTQDYLSEKVNNEYLIAKEWGESKIKSLRSNI